jgi:hypothetical protein
MNIIKLLILACISVSLYSEESLISILENNNWISDGDKTKSWIVTNRPNKASNDNLMSLFGRLKCKFKNGLWFSEMDGTINEKEYKVSAITGKEVVLITRESLLNRDIPIIIEFNESLTGYSIYVSSVDIREYFTIDKTAAQQK